MDLNAILMNATRHEDGDSSPQYYAVVCGSDDDDVSSPLDHVYLNSPHSTSSSDYASSPMQQVPRLEHWSINVIHKYTNSLTGKNPQLEIVEEPVDMFRFRYKSEMGGTHGSLIGRNSHINKNKKTFPSVKLKNYSGSAKIMCTLVQNEDSEIPRVHPHRLVVRYQDEIIDEPHVEFVSPDKGYTVRYPGMAIVHTAKKKVHIELYKKRKELLHTQKITLTLDDDTRLKADCESQAKNINMNSVRLCFTAYDSNFQQICDPVTSKPIDNLKSAETGALKITRMSKTTGSANGGEEIYMFVEKVSKKNIKIRFFEIEDNERTWSDYGTFSETDVHHQFGIVFWTPAYKNAAIRSKVTVYVELYRPKDGAVSDAKTFEYKPAAVNHKRRRAADNSLNSLQSSESYNAYDLPLTVAAYDNTEDAVLSHKKYMEEALCPDTLWADQMILPNREMDMGAPLVNNSLDGISRNDLMINSPFPSAELRPYECSLDPAMEEELDLVHGVNLVLDGKKIVNTYKNKNATSGKQLTDTNTSASTSAHCVATVANVPTSSTVTPVNIFSVANSATDSVSPLTAKPPPLPISVAKVLPVISAPICAVSSIKPTSSATIKIVSSTSAANTNPTTSGVNVITSMKSGGGKSIILKMLPSTSVASTNVTSSTSVTNKMKLLFTNTKAGPAAVKVPTTSIPNASVASATKAISSANLPAKSVSAVMKPPSLVPSPGSMDTPASTNVVSSVKDGATAPTKETLNQNITEARVQIKVEAQEETDKDELYPKRDMELAKEVIKRLAVLLKFKTVPIGTSEKLLEMFDVKLLDGNSFLHMSVATNHGRMVKGLLEVIKRTENYDILNYVNDRGETVLHTAIVFFRHEIMGLLLNAGCDPNLHDDDGNTPLHLAVREDNSECMVQLLDKNNYNTSNAKQMDVNIFNNAGWTALHLAAMFGSLASVSRLIRAGADCNVRGRSNGRTVLHLAVAHAHIVLVNYILEHSDIVVNAKGESGHTALHLACSLDNPRAHEICASLLRCGADPELKYNTMTALDFAKSNINVEVYNVVKNHLEADPSRKLSKQKYAAVETDSKKFQDSMEVEVKEEPYDFGEGFLDSKTIEIVTTLLNNSGMWKIIAVELGQSSLISLCQESENPSRTLLHYIELEEKISLNYLYELLLKLGETEAAAAVRNAIGYS